MLVKLLALLDLGAVIAVLAAPILPQKMMLYAGAYLMGKGGFFAMSGNIISILDVICGILILLLAFGISHSTINLFIIIFLIQKIIFSFI